MQWASLCETPTTGTRSPAPSACPLAGTPCKGALPAGLIGVELVVYGRGLMRMAGAGYDGLGGAVGGYARGWRGQVISWGGAMGGAVMGGRVSTRVGCTSLLPLL